MMRSAHTTDLGVLPDDQVEAPSHKSWNTLLGKLGKCIWAETAQLEEEYEQKCH